LGAVFFAALALGAVVASSAFAEDVWLVGGVAATLQLVETSGKLLFRILTPAGNIHFVCSGTFRGFVHEKGLDLVTEVVGLLTSEKLWISCNLLHGAGEEELGVCSGSLLILIMAINLPWHTQLLLLSDGTLFVDDFLLETGKTPGYETECTGAFGEKIKQSCEGGFKTDDLVNDSTGVLSSVLNELSDKCTALGTTAHITTTEPALTKTSLGAGVLSVSSK